MRHAPQHNPRKRKVRTMTAGKKRHKTITIRILCGSAVFLYAAFFPGCGERSSKGSETVLKPGQKVVTVTLPGGEKLDFVKVDAGTFRMSAPDGDNDSDEVAHLAELKRDYYIGKTEVTQAQWKAVTGTNPSKFKGNTLPVENVSWNEAMDFCEKLNSAGKAPDGWKFTLPTETQWEYAARGGDKSEGWIYSGSKRVGKVAWHYGNSGGRTHAVGKKKANELGLYDMSGNVWEWCLDEWSKKSDGLNAGFTGESFQEGSDRAIRGGSWYGSARRSRVSNRSHGSPRYRDSHIGFRLALVPVL